MDGWELVCREHRNKRWSKPLPLNLSCPHGHPILLNEEMLIENINIVPGRDLLNAITEIINSYLKGYSIDPTKETFFIHGSNLWYFPNRNLAPASITVIQNIGIVRNGGVVKGVEITGPPAP
jgi:hypothetical protein